MRRCLLAVLLVALWSLPASAQRPIEPGVWVVGGNARFRAGRDIDSNRRYHAVEIAPLIGVFIFPGLALSANSSFGWSKPAGGVPSTFIGFGPGLTYYVSGVGKRFFPYGAVRTFVEFGHREGNIGPDDDPFEVHEHTRDWQWVAALGAAQFLSRNAALVAELYYSRYGGRLTGDVSGHPLNRSSRSEDYGLQFGLRVFLF